MELLARDPSRAGSISADSTVALARLQGIIVGRRVAGAELLRRCGRAPVLHRAFKEHDHLWFFLAISRVFLCVRTRFIRNCLCCALAIDAKTSI